MFVLLFLHFSYVAGALEVASFQKGDVILEDNNQKNNGGQGKGVMEHSGPKT